MGRYSIHYSLQGHQVKAVEVVPSQVARLKEKIAKGEAGSLEAYLGDARNLTMIEDGSIDVVLCLGPLYHLQKEQDRIRCISEALRVLKPGGILAFTYISRFFYAVQRFKRNLEKVHVGMIETLLDQGIVQDSAFDDGFSLIGYFATPDEIETLMTRFKVNILDHVGIDGASKLMEDVVDKMTEAEFKVWMEYHLRTCRERSLLGYSTHGLVICQKY
jgi:SAM-dependent methyltransferase